MYSTWAFRLIRRLMTVNLQYIEVKIMLNKTEGIGDNTIIVIRYK